MYQDLSEIYCGGLDSEVPKGRDLEKTTLKLAIAFSSSPLREATDENSTIIDDNNLDQKIETPATTTDSDQTKDTTPSDNADTNNPEVNSTSSDSETPSQTTKEIDSVPAEQVIKEDAPTSFRLINIAHAEEVQPDAQLDNSTEAVKQDTSTTTEVTDQTNNQVDINSEASTTTEEGSGSIDAQTNNIDQSQDPVFMEIYYTLDGGKTLNLIDRITATNWKDKDFEYNIPITKWADLTKFQVSLHGVSAVENEPIVYLDSAWLITEHKAMKEDTTDEEQIDATAVEKIYSGVIKSDDFNSLKKQDFTHLDEGAVSCDVNPFSQQILRGGSARFEIKISDNTKPYRLTFGKIPDGISIETDKNSSTDNFIFTVSAKEDAELGSFNVSVLYEIINEETDINKNECQFNVIVKE